MARRIAAIARDLIDELLAETRYALKNEEMLLGADPAAVVLPAPASHGFTYFRSSYQDDWAFDFRRGRVEISLIYLRAPRYGGERAHSWSGMETRTDVFGRPWTRSFETVFVMDDFGDLVEAPRP
jgi:hypothetical protein